MIHYHPDDNMLIEFGNGSLDWGLCILVSAHIEQCRLCKAKIKTQERIGAVLLCTSKMEPSAADSLDKLLTKIQLMEQAATQQKLPLSSDATPSPCDVDQVAYPKVVNKLLRHRTLPNWQRISRSLKARRLITGQTKYEISLHNICSGGQVSEHDHRGLEITLVIKGCFSDAQGLYGPGDFIRKEPGQIHRPTASQNEDCLCLSAVEAPVKLTGFIGRCINPFLTIHPM